MMYEHHANGGGRDCESHYADAKPPPPHFLTRLRQALIGCQHPTVVSKASAQPCWREP